MKNMIKLILLATVLPIALTVYGCISSGPAATVSSEAGLEKRINGLMTAKINGDWKQVYAFFNGAYKNRVPESKFGTARKAQFLDYQIERIEMNDPATEARVSVNHTILFNGMTVDSIDTQIWVFEKDNWYLTANPDSGF